MAELAWPFRFDRLVKGGQGLRVMLGIHCCPVLQEVYQKGAILVKEECQHNLSALLWMALDFLVVVTLDASTGDFVVSILVENDDTKTHLQPALVPGTYSLPWHSAADDQYSGPFDVLPAHFAPVQSSRHDGVNTSDAQSDISGYGFHCNSAVMGNESINQLDDVIGNAVWSSRPCIIS